MGKEFGVTKARGSHKPKINLRTYNIIISKEHNTMMSYIMQINLNNQSIRKNNGSLQHTLKWLNAGDVFAMSRGKSTLFWPCPLIEVLGPPCLFETGDKKHAITRASTDLRTMHHFLPSPWQNGGNIVLEYSPALLLKLNFSICVLVFLMIKTNVCT